MAATATTGTMSAATSAFLEKDAFFVEERRTGLRARNEYCIWNAEGVRVGALLQPVSLVGLFWRIFLRASILPYRLEIIDNQGKVLASIRRGWTIFVSRIEIFDAGNNVVGFLKHKYRSRKPRIKVYNAAARKVGEITGTQSNWNMSIIDFQYIAFGSIREFESGKTPGDTSSKNTYYISLTHSPLAVADRNVMLIAAIAIDRLLLGNE